MKKTFVQLVNEVKKSLNYTWEDSEVYARKLQNMALEQYNKEFATDLKTNSKNN